MSPATTSPATTTRVLITGAGGPAGVAVIRSLLRRPDLDVFAADMDGWASGLYLVPADRRRLVVPGSDPGFVDAVAGLIAEDAIDVLVSTVDVELLPLAERRETLGAVLAAPNAATLATALDKYALAIACTGIARVPTTVLLGDRWTGTFPVIVKPRRGAGSRGVHLVTSREALAAEGTDDQLIVQEYLPGDEYSVDVIAGPGGVIAAVPRTRTRVDSGVSIAGMTVHDEGLEATATAVATAIGLVGVANVQLRRDAEGNPALLEVNPRFPGAMPLTIAAGVDMPSLAVDLALGRPVPASVPFREIANVRFLEDVFLDPAEILESAFAAHTEES